MAKLDVVRSDCHVHSTHSDGEARPEEIPELARRAGLGAVAITDHYDPHAPDYHPAQGGYTDLRRLDAMLKWRDQARLTEAEQGVEGVRVWVGIERGPAPVPLAALMPDLVIASVHYLTESPPVVRGRVFDEAYWHAYMQDVLRVASGPQVDVVGHVAGYLPMRSMLSPGSTFEERREIEREIARRFFIRDWYEQVFRAAAARGAACELHCPTKSPSPDMVRLGLDMGVRFSAGSDAHIASWIGDVGWAYDLLDSLGARPGDVWVPKSVR